MPVNWKDKVDEYNRKIAEEERMYWANKRANRKQEELDERLKLQAEFDQKSFCHVCGVHSSGPTIHDSYKGSDGHMNEGWIDWQKPKDLVTCSKCHKLTCTSEECIHGDICRICAESKL